MKEMIDKWVSVGTQSAPGGTASEAPASEPSGALDMVAVDEARASLKDKFPKLVGYYLEDSADYMSQMEGALSDGALEKIGAPAHALKSSSRLLGAIKVSEIARELEMASKAVAAGSQPPIDIGAQVAALRAALAQAQPELEQFVDANSG